MGHKVEVRWVDAQTGEDFTDGIADPCVAPGSGVFEVARALGRLMAAQQAEAERQLLDAARAGLRAGVQKSLARNPEPGDRLIVNGVSYRYDGSNREGDHFTDWLVRLGRKPWFL